MSGVAPGLASQIKMESLIDPYAKPLAVLIPLQNNFPPVPTVVNYTYSLQQLSVTIAFHCNLHPATSFL
jgi:hypothetical protein